MIESENVFLEPMLRGRHLRRALGVMQIIEGIRDSLLVHQPVSPDPFYEAEPIIHVTDRSAGWDSEGNYHYQEPWDVT